MGYKVYFDCEVIGYCDDDGKNARIVFEGGPVDEWEGPTDELPDEVMQAFRRVFQKGNIKNR